MVLERRVRTERSRLGDVLGARSRRRVLIEASTESEWVATALEMLGHEVIVADRHYTPMYATRTCRVKTDRRDARALAEANRGRHSLRMLAYEDAATTAPSRKLHGQYGFYGITGNSVAITRFRWEAAAEPPAGGDGARPPGRSDK